MAMSASLSAPFEILSGSTSSVGIVVFAFFSDELWRCNIKTRGQLVNRRKKTKLKTVYLPRDGLEGRHLSG